MQNYTANYWGKARRHGESGPDWHPISYHGLDVAAAGDALLSRRPEYLNAIAQMSGLPPECASSWLLFALALHDLGKFGECFQAKWRHIGTNALGRVPTTDPGHGLVGKLLWDCSCDLDLPVDSGRFRDVFNPIGGSPAKRSFSSWMNAVFGHHGRPVQLNGSEQLKNLISPVAAADARSFVYDCAALFLSTTPRSPVTFDEKAVTRASWLVAGIAMLADWMGSNQGWFPYQKPTTTLADYWSLAQARAAKAVDEAHLSGPAIAPGFDLHDALAAPSTAVVTATPLQAWVRDDFAPSGQTLLIIEDLTGAGKTEAALIAAHRLMKAGAAEGLYWALPTMATANSLYGRLGASYRRLFEAPDDVSLVLAHGKRDFNDTFKRSALPAGAHDRPFSTTSDDEASSAQCAAWIADDRRKAFLADVGVGTLDQALLGVLPAKHQAMRLATLARRVLVCDEIHSYDAYTGRLLQELLTFHAATGGSAILLTATLTQKLRRDLTKAFETGARWRNQDRRGQLKETSFPLITMVTKDGLIERPQASGRGTRRDLHVTRLESEEAAIDVLAASQSGGEAAVWIRNTVHDAIAAYRQLKPHLGDKIDLFHARFALGDRIKRETTALDAFGKGNRPNRNRVLIATQVVEQALDLDFDVMVTDLAPIDLLIQRAGRLHRHERGARSEPVLHVVSPAPLDDAPATWFAKMFPKGQYVYADHGQLWLTAKHVLGHGLKLASASPRIPIEEVYAEQPNLPVALEGISGRALGAAMAERGHAAMNALKLADGYAQSSGLWASDTVTPTRLGAKQRLLRLAKWDGTSLLPWYSSEDAREAWRLSEVQVLAARLASVTMSKPQKLAHDRVIASWGDSFDPPLLVPMVRDGDVWRATGIDERGQEVAIEYSASIGLVFQASQAA